MPLLMLVWATAPQRRASAQQPAKAQQEQPAKNPKVPQESNPFPEDTNSVPVLPSASSPATPAPDASDYGSVALPRDDDDPVKSPDDAVSADDVSGSSDSSAGMDNLLKPPPDEDQGKHHRPGEPDQPHVESAKEDESVGSYYLDQKNWKAALSRYESAVVLDPENPDVYWGLAEAQRHTGNYASAKANYQKVMEYDPDSKHSKEAKKILKEPDMANAKAISSNAGSPQQRQ
jgi:tetratricopeptide (TPR) repeat protein